MKIQITEHGDVSAVRPEDRLDIVGYLELEECFQELIGRGRSRIVLDLEETTFINSTALAVIGRFWADCAKEGGRLVIARPSREARAGRGASSDSPLREGG
jgi:anti-sigma B factor antagonist